MQRRKTGREEKKNGKGNGKGGMGFHIYPTCSKVP